VLRFFAFRLMLSAGLVKWFGSPKWRDLTAMEVRATRSTTCEAGLDSTAPRALRDVWRPPGALRDAAASQQALVLLPSVYAQVGAQDEHSGGARRGAAAVLPRLLSVVGGPSPSQPTFASYSLS
jgi:hypothetical protein